MRIYVYILCINILDMQYNLQIVIIILLIIIVSQCALKDAG